MRSINAVFFWFGGVIVPAVPDITIALLQERTGLKLDFWTRIAIRDLAQDLTLGRLDGLTYSKRAIDATGANILAKDFEVAILRSATLNTSALDVLAELPASCRIWLVSDYPPSWLAQISRRLAGHSFLDMDRTIFSANYQLHRLVPYIYYLLVQETREEMYHCMMVDADTVRSVEAVKHGLSSEIFTDAPRLRRAFVLRNTIPKSSQA